MSDAKLLASFVSSEVHGEDDYVRVYGSSVTDAGEIYIEGDIDGEEFYATLTISGFGLVGDDDDLEDEGEGEDE